MIEMLKRHEIQVLRRAGHTWKEVAALSGVSVRTVRRIAAETAVTTIDNAAERVRRQVGRPSTSEAYREVLVRALTEAGGVRGRQECSLCAGAESPDACGDAAGPVRRPPRRILAA
jgi:transposase